MLDDYKFDQPIAFKILKNAIKKNNYSHAYLFETHGYKNSLEFIFSFVKAILCPNGYCNSEKCGSCKNCQIIDDNNNVELKIIEPDGSWIKKDQLLDLQNEFSKKALLGNKKIYIIKEADKMNPSSANSILKFLEEPEENIIAILLVDNKYQLLDTIVSRCQVISLFNQNASENNNYLEKLQSIINIQKIDEEKINKALSFVDYYEKNGLDTILNMHKVWHQFFSEKEIINEAFEIITLYYMDILNYSCGYHIKIFNEFIGNIKMIASVNDVNNLLKKINIILKIKDLIKFNVNTNLLMDKLVLELEEIKND